MAESQIAWQQAADLFAVATAHRYTGPMTFHWRDGVVMEVDHPWRLKVGPALQRYIRIFRGQPPPGSP